MAVTLESVLDANALVSLDEAKAHCGIVRQTTPADLHAEDQRVVEAINWVSMYVETAIRPMAKKAEVLRLAPPRTAVLKLARAPIDVDQPVVLTINGVPQSVWRKEADGARASFRAWVHSGVPGSRWTPDGLVLRAGATSGHGYFCGCGCGGWGSAVDPEPILLSYTGGFDCLPESGPNQLPGDMRVAVLDAVRAWYRNEQQGTADIASIAQPGGGPTFDQPRWMPYGAWQIMLQHRPVSLVLT